MRILTIIESPYAGDRVTHITYMYRAIQDSIMRGEVPFASHGFFPDFLFDENEEERQLGIHLGYEFWKAAKRVAFYTDYGMSPGMKAALEYHKLGLYKQDQPDQYQGEPDLPIEIREIGKNGD